MSLRKNDGLVPYGTRWKKRSYQAFGTTSSWQI